MHFPVTDSDRIKPSEYTEIYASLLKWGDGNIMMIPPIDRRWRNYGKKDDTSYRQEMAYLRRTERGLICTTTVEMGALK